MPLTLADRIDGALIDASEDRTLLPSQAVWHFQTRDGELVREKYPRDGWITVSSADDAQTLLPGRYQVEADASFGVLLQYAAGEEWLINGRGQEDDNNVSVGAATDTFSYHDAATDTEVSAAGPFVVDETKHVRLIASPTVANSYRIVTETGGGGSSLDMQDEQSANFTAEVGKEYPVDLSGFAAGGRIDVAQPVGTASVGDSFAVFDSRLAADNGIDFPATGRTVQVNFTDNLHSLPGPDFAVINSAGARLEFVYADAVVGWRIESNVNA